MKRFLLKPLPIQRLWKNITTVQHWDLSIWLGKSVLITFQNIITLDTKWREFQYKILHPENLLHKCHVVQIWFCWNSIIGYFCNDHEELETLEHLLYHCEKVNTFWSEIITILKSQDLVSTNFGIKNIIFGHFCSDDDDSVLVSFLLIILFSRESIWFFVQS